MKAELVLMGKRINMAPRAHRRTLVVLIYSTLALMMACLWPLDQWRTSGSYIILATLLVNRLFFGGYIFGGLIKPFNNKAPHRTVDPPPHLTYLMVVLRVYRPGPEEDEYRNDERELQQRDRAHYQAYQVIAVMLTLLWLLGGLPLRAPWLLASIPFSANGLLSGLGIVVAVIAFTLPQAILLWTEPDMEEAPIA